MSNIKKEVIVQFERMQALQHRYQARSFLNFGPGSNPNRGQGLVLRVLKMQPEISQKDLTYLLDMSKQSVAELLVKLEKSGYITREPSEEDRRTSNIKLTAEGCAVADEMDDTSQETGKAFDCLSDEEMKILSDFLGRIIKQLEELSGDENDLREQMMKKFKENHPDGFGERGSEFGRGRFGGGFSDGRRDGFGGEFHGRHSDDDKKGGR